MKTLIVTEETIYSGIFFSMFKDLIDSGETSIVNKYINEKNPIRNILLKILYKDKINKYLKGCFESILNPEFCISQQLDTLSEEDVVVIFTNASLQKVYSEKNLKKIKEKYPNAHFVLLMVDSVFQPQARRAVLLSKKNIFDLVYTYNKEDAEANNFLYWPTPYSFQQDVLTENVIRGVYFCGSDKGRAKQLDRIAHKFKENGIKYKFDVYGPKKDYMNFSVRPYKLKQYKDILTETLKYNTILDICQKSEGSKCGLSLRVYEAVVYKRNLITNNACIKEFEYYDPSYMHYIEDENDIQPEWFDGMVENRYVDQLSPKYLINNIREKLCNTV